MAELLEASDIMFTPFEPKLQHRFVMLVDGIPSYLIKTAAKPQITFDEVELNHINTKHWVKGKGAWDQLEITLYDPIVPSAAQQVMEWVNLHKESVTGRDGFSDFYKKDITIQGLDPTGGVIEEWILKNSFIVTANFGSLDWSASEVVEIALTLRYDYAILQF